MRPVNDKASRDAWIMLACAIEEKPFKNANAGKPMDSRTDRNLHQNSSGHGFRPQELAHCTELGKRLLNLDNHSWLGSSPTEFRYRRTKE